jgi:putative addiction module component (TIGR02574 family)
MNKATLRKELMELSPAERLELIGELWDSIPPEDVSPLTPEQQQELDRRYEAMLRDPDRGAPWEEVKARLWAKYR